MTFFIGVGLVSIRFFFFLDAAESAAEARSLVFESKLAAHSAYCYPVWATGSGLGPFFPYFSWDYFCTKTAAGEKSACLCLPESAALGTPRTSRVSFLGARQRKEGLRDLALTIFQGNVSICQILVP